MDWRKMISTKADSEKILKLFREEGLSVRQLTERFNTTAVKIREIIRKGGMTLGARGARKMEEAWPGGIEPALWKRVKRR